MKRWLSVCALLAGATSASAASICEAAAMRSAAVPPRVAAVNPRCNADVAGSLERQVRADDRRPPAPNVDALTQRYASLDAILQQAQFERDILQDMCTDAERAPIDDHLAGVIAWAYALEADLAAKRFALLKCPAAVSTVPPALLASAWYALASTLNDPSRPSPAPSATRAPLVAEVTSKVRARAVGAGLTLPPTAQATEYWRDSIVAKAAGCPSPSPR